MRYGSPPSSFSDSDLNGLVDGQIEPGRQAELVRRLKSHEFETARVAAWREQNDLLKASFSEVINEPIPLSLSLTPPPRLKCVTNEGWRSNKPASAGIAPLTPGLSKQSRPGIIGFGALIACIVLLGCWLVADHAASIEPQPLILAATGTDGMLATPSFVIAKGKGGGTIAAQPTQMLRVDRHLPATTIPDLAEMGFTFTGATVRDTTPATLVFSYRDLASNRLDLAIADITSAGPIDASFTPPGGQNLTWRLHDTLYTLTGTPERNRLNAIAAVLQGMDRSADATQ